MTVLNLTTQQLQSLTSLQSQGDHPGAYSYLRTILNNEIYSDTNNTNTSEMVKISNWLYAAESINKNDGGFYSDMVRGSMKLAAAAKGHLLSDSDFQIASDALATSVIDDIISAGGILSSDDIIQSDVSSAVNDLGLERWNWAGTLGDILPSPIGLGGDYVQIQGSTYLDWMLNFTEASLQNFAGLAKYLNIDEPLGSVFDWMWGDLGLDAFGRALGSADSFSGFIDALKYNFGQALQTVSPLVLDLDGNGIKTIGVSAGIHFDHDGNGLAEASGWMGEGEALLVWDKNHNGLVDSGAELFGNQSILPSGAKATNGFEALKLLDSNKDGVFDSNDAQFYDIKAWKDLNSDGISQANELYALDAVGVRSISLDYQQSTDVDAAGNQHSQSGSYTRSDGTVASIEDIWFASNPTDTVDLHPVTLSEDISALPDVKASGSVHNLRQAMQLDATGELQRLVEDFMNAPVSGVAPQVIDNIIYTWIGVTGVDPTSRGGYLDARKVSVVEAFMGQGFMQGEGEYEGTPNPSLYSSKILSEIYDNLANYVAANLNLHKPAYESIITEVKITLNGDGALVDVGNAVTALSTVYASDTLEGRTFLEGFYNSLLAAKSGGNELVNALKQHGNPTGLGFEFDLATANEWIHGTSGSETLNDTTGHHVFDTGGGGDWINATGGNDVFIYNAGYGYLEINNAYTEDGYAVLKLGPGITASSISVTMTESGNSLIITDGIDGDEIVLDYSLIFQNYGVKTVVFDDGSTLSRSQLIGMKDKLIEDKNATGTNGSDTLTGTPGAQVFDGKGGGPDWAHGGGGDDVFIFNAGYGYLEIDEGYLQGEKPVLQLGPGLTAASLAVTTTESGNSIVLSDGIDGDMIVLDYSLIYQNYGVETVRFTDGSTLSKQQLVALKDEWVNNKIGTGTAGNDTLTGTAAAQNFDGKGGQDVITGGGGSDVFNYKPGYGYLEIINGYVDADNPTLRFGPGITLQSLQVTTTSSGNSMILTDGIDGDMVVLDYNLIWPNYGVKTVEFDDGTFLTKDQLVALKDEWINVKLATGTTGNDNLNGTAGAQSFDGKGGQDVITGGGGDDTFAFNAGYGYLEIINGYLEQDNPVLKFGPGISVQSLQVTTTASGNSMILSDGIAGDMVVLDYNLVSPNYGVKSVQFSDGSSLSMQQLITMKDEWLNLTKYTGTSGSDTLNGTSSSQTFDGKGGGPDWVYGNGGSDTFKYNAGYGYLEIDNGYTDSDNPVLLLGGGITAQSLQVSTTSSGNSMILTDGTEGDMIVLDYSLSQSNYGVKSVVFSDGSTLSKDQLLALKDEWLALTKYTGTIANDNIYGDSNAQVIDGKGGIDVVYGSGGNDTFIFNKGYGYLEIINAYRDYDNPTLKFGSEITMSSLVVSSTESGNSLILKDGIDGDMVVLDYSQIWTNYGVTSVQFSNGTSISNEQLVALKNISIGSTGADYFSGTAGSQAFDGMGGNDVVHSGGGNDLIKYNQGYGSLEIDASYSGTEAPMLIFGTGITASNLTASASSSGTDLIIYTGREGDSIQLDQMLSTYDHGVKSIQFADGSAMTATQLIELAHIPAIEPVGVSDSVGHV